MTESRVQDLIVVVPGIQGSALARHGQPVWEFSGRAAWQAIKSLGGSIKSLRLPDDIGDEHPNDGVEAIGLMGDLHGLPGLGPFVRGYTGLVDWLQREVGLVRVTTLHTGNLLEFAYDWRLSNRYNASLLKVAAEAALLSWRKEGHPGAKLVLICHSMGGLVARYYLEVLGGAEWTRSLVTMGTPHRGSANAVVSLVNGVRVGTGPFKLDVSALARSLPSSYQLLPTYRCVNTPGGRQDLVTADLPNLNRTMVSDAASFHDEISRGSGGAADYSFRMVVGSRQPTRATVTLSGGSVEPANTIDGNDERGDGTVPRFASIPADVEPSDLRQLSSAQTHGWLHLHPSVLDDLYGILTTRDVIYMDGPPDLQRQVGVDMPELLAVGQPLRVEASSEDASLLLEAQVRYEDGGSSVPVTMTNEGDGTYGASFDIAEQGVHEVTVRGRRGAGLDDITREVLVAEVDGAE